MKNSIDLNDKYIPLFKNKTRYNVITGGRGSGKSFGINVFLLNLTYESGHKILFTRYTMSSAHTSIIPEFVEKIDMMGVNAHFRITKDEITNMQTGSSIIFKGIRTSSGNQTAALKSLNGITTFVVDEAEELDDEGKFDTIDFSIRSLNKQNRVILILNPTTKEHWIYQRFFLGNIVDEGFNGSKGDTTYIHTTYRDNKDNLSQSFLARILDMKAKRPDKYQHQILGGWLAKAEGTIIRNWKVGDYIQMEKTIYGQDFGFSEDPTTLVKISVDDFNSRVYVKEIYGKTGLSTSDIANMNRAECGLDLIVCDSSEPRLIKELKKKGLNIQPAVKKSGSILSGIALMQDYEIIVDPRSKGVIKEFNNYVWHEKGVRPIDKFNHFCDAIRYALMRLTASKSKGIYTIR
tara:strand:+ start:453 stop:1667 length:1215 start_codon:yes stop_codon:yes gene_type:complete